MHGLDPWHCTTAPVFAAIRGALARQLTPIAAGPPSSVPVCKGGSRVGFDVVALDGRRAPLSRVSAKKGGGPRVGKYAVDLEGFEALALPLLRERADAKLVVIDEVRAGGGAQGAAAAAGRGRGCIHVFGGSAWDTRVPPNR